MTDAPIWCDRGGDSGAILILLHGLGANAAVWDGLKLILAERWKGKWIIPDLRGHGRSLHRAPYSIESYAADIAALIPRGADVSIIGHSMGGAIAMVLASSPFGMRVRQVVASSIKVDWSDEELARGAAMAIAPAKAFDSKADAVERYLRVSGLKGLVAPDSPTIQAGVRESQGRFYLATDPKTTAVGKLDFPAIASAVKADLLLLCGDRDAIAQPEAMRGLGSEVTILPGLGHNPHVEAPHAFWSALESRVG